MARRAAQLGTAWLVGLAACGGSEEQPTIDAPMMMTGCSSENECAAPTPYCETSTRTCVECRFASHCAATKEVCSAQQCAPARSCKQLHAELPALGSGMYTLDPDDSGSDAPFEVWCDMTTDGGGWTIVFNSENLNFDGASAIAGYTSSTPRLLTDATQSLIAFRTSAMATTGDYARFPLPTTWKAAAPFDVAGTDESVEVSINGGTAATQMLRYGRDTFQSFCADAWITTNLWGRICIVGTTAPHYASFATASADHCSISNESYATTACSAERKFTIAVR